MKLRNAAYIFLPPTFYSSQTELLTLPQSFLPWLTLALGPPRLGLQVGLAFPFRFHVPDPSDTYPRPNRVR